MSTDTHSSTGAGFLCEAVTSDTIVSPCIHSRRVNTYNAQSIGIDRGVRNADDPAVLIGLTLALVRQGALRDGPLLEPLMLRLKALADGGNSACRLLIDWLQNRNRNLRRLGNEHLTPSSAVVASAEPRQPRRSPRERVLAQPQPTRSVPMDERRRGRTRPRDPVWNSETAIVAAERGGRVDG